MIGMVAFSAKENEVVDGRGHKWSTWIDWLTMVGTLM